jgi:hypothetical protein
MRLSRLILVVTAGLLAGACNTTSRLEQRTADEKRCRSYGFRPATDAFSKCLLQVDLDRAADRRALSGYPYGYGYGYGSRGWGWGRSWW